MIAPPGDARRRRRDGTVKPLVGTASHFGPSGMVAPTASFLGRKEQGARGEGDAEDDEEQSLLPKLMKQRSRKGPLMKHKSYHR